MNFTGQELIHTRNFYTQNDNFDVLVNCQVNNTTGIYSFGVTGNSSFQIDLISGKIYKDNLFIHSYVPYEQFSIRMQLTSGNYNIYKNENPLVLGQTKVSDNYDSFFFNRQYNTDSANFDVFISGSNKPNIFIQQIGYIFSTGQVAVTGEIINYGPFDYRVFDSNASLLQNLTFDKITGNIQSGQTGYFTFNGDLNNFDTTQFILVNTYSNYNYNTFNFYILDISSFGKTIVFKSMPPLAFNSLNQINSPLQYNNYSGGFYTNDFNAEFSFILNYVSGSGLFKEDNIILSGFYNVIGYGNFIESGNLTGLSIVVTGTSQLSGQYVITGSNFAWATGIVTGYFSGIGTGMASGIGYTGIGVGPFTGLIIDTIYPNSGTLYYNNTFVTGFGLESQSLDYQGYIQATGFVNLSGLNYDDIIYIGVDDIPLIKGLQFNDPTELCNYLSGNINHEVSSVVGDDNILYLTSLLDGDFGNGTFVKQNQCNAGSMINYSSFLTGGGNIGITGLTVYPISEYGGIINAIFSGSGDYSTPISGNSNGIFFFVRPFIGVWDLWTGTSPSSIISLTSQNFNTASGISGYFIGKPNSTVYFKVSHNDSNFNVDVANLIISGQYVVNPINQLISQ